MLKTATSSTSQVVAHPPARPSTSGFEAQLHGANLWDLVQIECMAWRRSVVRVTTQGDIGYLYFNEGQITHATTLQSDGEAAALEVLQWTHGTFEVCDRDWPAKESIRSSWQSLLLRAAQLHDDTKRKLVAFPKDRITSSRELPPPAPVIEPVTKVSQPPPANDEPPELVVRLAPSGSVLFPTGADLAVHSSTEVQEFAETIAYTRRLIHLVGEQMGMEGFKAVEFTFKRGRCILYEEDDGNVVALKPSPSSDLTELREKLGL
jgi:hypothetical protein